MKGVRTWREFAAACVLAVMALGGASGPALAEVVARPSGQAGALTLHGPVLFYGDRAGNRSVVHRRELATGADRIVYRAPPGMLVTRLEAGGGTLGVGLQGTGAREDALTRVVAISVFASLAGPPTATFAGADGASEVLLCGERVVEVAPFPDSPDVPRVVVRALDGSGARAPALSTGPEASPRAQACTADRLVIALTDDDGERSTIEVVQLEP